MLAKSSEMLAKKELGNGREFSQKRSETLAKISWETLGKARKKVRKRSQKKSGKSLKNARKIYAIVI